jgi:hypothetical protein
VTGLPSQQNSGTPNPTGSDASNSDTQVDDSAGSPAESGQTGGQVFGGGPILGVASTSKDKTIREFNKKNHYNEWLFVYSANSDRGGLLKGPLHINTMGSGNLSQPGAPPAAPGQPGANPQPAGPPTKQEPPEE